jgi:hypothetical protein
MAQDKRNKYRECLNYKIRLIFETKWSEVSRNPRLGKGDDQKVSTY